MCAWAAEQRELRGQNGAAGRTKSQVEELVRSCRLVRRDVAHGEGSISGAERLPSRPLVNNGVNLLL